MKIVFLASVLLLTSSLAFAQPQDDSAADASLATPMGHEVSVGVGSYTYTEPGATQISIHGPKVAGEYTATLPVNERHHWFAQANVRGTIGHTTYTGWCSPFLITPDGGSPNGYALDIGDPSPCDESGDMDWYLEGRALAGKDLIGQRWAFSPYSGVGLRHLSNGVTGTAGYRTDDYLYLPVGVTSRTRVASDHALGFTLEGDVLLHGWQKTRDSALGGGDIPATPAAPAFTIDGFSDVSFSQSKGLALRASAKYQMTRHWAAEPYYVFWHVGSSPVNYETATYTVNHVTAREQLGAYEPVNHTHEIGVKLTFHF